MFRGLFIGIDRYASTRINWLSCARRDAVALRALFADNLGGDARLLADVEATRDAIRDKFDNLAMQRERCRGHRIFRPRFRNA